VRERDIEQYLREQVKKVKGKAFKWVSPGNAGVPDRVILFPGGKVVFAETKAPGKKLTPLQENQIRKIKEMGFSVVVIDSKQGVDEFIRQYSGVELR
jgi:hypothetical protein